MSVFKNLLPGKSRKQSAASGSTPQGASGSTPHGASGSTPRARSVSRSDGQSSSATIPDSRGPTQWAFTNRHLQLFASGQDQGPRHSVSQERPPRHSVSHERPSRNSSRNSTTAAGRHSVDSERPMSTRVLFQPDEQQGPRMPPFPNPPPQQPHSRSSGASASASSSSVHLCPPRELFLPTHIPKIPELDPETNLPIYDEDPFTTAEEAYTYEPFSQPLLSVRIRGQLTDENGKFMFF